MPTMAASSSSGGSTGDPGPPAIHPSDLIASLPTPVLRLIVIFAWPISSLRSGLEVLSWKSGRRTESWILIAAWWAICLGSRHTFSYLLPPLVFLPLLPLSRLRLPSVMARSPLPRPDPSQPTTSETLLLTLSELHTIHALLPPSPIPTAATIYARFRQLGARRLCRGLVVLWAAWVVLGKLIGFRSLLGLVGTVFLLLPSPPLAHIVALLSKSLAVRRALALAFLFTFGSPHDQAYQLSLKFSPVTWAQTKWAASRRPSLAFPFKTRPPVDSSELLHGLAVADNEKEKAGNPIYFRFEVHENQRWWMGLDWTSALLPQERPSWCDLHLLPVSPPATYSLPPAASIILPSPSTSDPQAKIKRISTWRWLDDDWSVARAGPGASAAPHSQHPAVSPVAPDDEASSGYTLGNEKRNPSVSIGTSPPTASSATMEDNAHASASMRAQSIAEQAFTKGLEKLKARTGGPMGVTSPAKKGRTGSQASEDLHDLDSAGQAALPTETIKEKDDATDADGWVYGDNKWESMGPKSGLGKFTRRRRWQRRAVCTETVQRLPASPAGGTNPSGPITTPLKSKPLVSPTVVKVEPIVEERSEEREKEGLLIPPGTDPSRDDILRQRLKKAMSGVGG